MKKLQTVEDWNRDFWIRVHKTDGCWNWIGAKNNKGYGVFHEFRRHRNILSHRLSWQLANRHQIGELCCLHHCDNPGCVNPDHLFIGTKKDNMQDCIRKGRLRQPDRSGSKGTNAFLTEEQVHEIRFLAGIITEDELAEIYGIKQPGIHKVIARQTWVKI